jgi:predicted nucleic acid-binding protein
MLFIYMFEDNARFAPRVASIYESHKQNGDLLFTSYLSLGEVLAGVYNLAPERAEGVKAMFAAAKFRLLPFGSRCAEPFGRLRSQKISSADALHLATASAENIDLFLTGDKRLQKLRVPGIKFVADIDLDLF